jgi:hypothetical protein
MAVIIAILTSLTIAKEWDKGDHGTVDIHSCKETGADYR